VLPVPEIHNWQPTTIYNIAAFSSVIVKGNNFIYSSSFKCFYPLDKESTNPVYLSESEIHCPLSLDRLSSSSEIELQISNDNLKSLSSTTAKINIVKDLPSL